MGRTYYIKNLSEYSNKIQKAFKCKGFNVSNVSFRGQDKRYDKILASVFRDNQSDYYEVELIKSAKQRCPSLFNDCKDALDRLVLMQHFTLPTRLLDITRNPYIALYFACQGSEEDDGVVYYTYQKEETHKLANYFATALENFEFWGVHDCERLLNILIAEGVVSSLKDKDKFKLCLFENLTKSFIYQPPYINDRIRNQEGAVIFSALMSVAPISNDEYNKLKNEWSSKHDEVLFEKKSVDLTNIFMPSVFMIKGECKKEILKELDLMGINEAFVYPEPEHQMNYIKNSFHKIEGKVDL